MTVTHILVDFENTQPGAQEVALVTGAHLRLWIFRGPGQKKYDAEFAEAMMLLGDRVQVVRCEKSGRNALDMHIAFQLGRLVGALGDAQPDEAAPQFVIVSRDTDYEPVIQYMQRAGFSARRVTTLKAAINGGRGEPAPAPRAAKGRAPAAKKTAARAPAPPRAGRSAAKDAPKAAAKGGATAAKGTAKTAAKSAAKGVAQAGGRRAAKGAAAAGADTAAASASRAAVDAVQLDRLIAELKNHPKSRPVRLTALRKWLSARARSADEADALIAAMQARGVLRASGTKLEYPGWG